MGVDGAELRVLKESNEVGLGGFLDGADGLMLKAQVDRGAVVGSLSDLAAESLEREPAYEEFVALLIAPDLSEGHRSGAESVRLLDASAGFRGTSLSLLE